MKSLAIAAFVVVLAAPAYAKPIERRLHSDMIEASTFLWNDWNKFVENYHPNYVADDDPKTAWVEGATTTGAGEWLRIHITPLDKTTRVRLRVRNGYQKSKALWKANARAKDITVRLLPSKIEKQLTLRDADGWQDIVIDQPVATVRGVEIAVRSVYEGTKYTDLCISDVQVFATSDTRDNPAFEKSKRATLMQWRAERLAAAKMFKTKRLELPLHPAYEVTSKPHDYDGGPELHDVIALAAKDPAFVKEWKDALAIAANVAGRLDSLPRVKIAPTSRTKLVEVDGIDVTELGEIQSGEGPYLSERTFRLPMLGAVASLFADQLRAIEDKDKTTLTAFNESKKCNGPMTWGLRRDGKEGPQTLQALLVGYCGMVEGREGSWLAHTHEILVYDAKGRLVLLVGMGHVNGYRWFDDAGAPKLASARSALWYPAVFVDAKARTSLAAK